MLYFLQNRWKIEGKRLHYYGLRCGDGMFKNTVKLSSAQAALVKKLPCELGEADVKKLGRLLGKQVVAQPQLNITPKSLEEATFCKECAANDFIIPGLEFGEDGLCPMCQTADFAKTLKSVVPVKNTFERSKKSRFDIAVFYTGGKDSTYLLYYLAKRLGLRVLALTWEIPFMSDSARASIENAKTRMPSVEFISRRIADADLKTIYGKLYELAGNTCACPSLAYALFYPELVENKVPYFAAGNESAQLVGLYYNHMAPKLAYKFSDNKFLNFMINVGRVLTLRPPLKKGQFHTLATMKQLAYGDNPIKKISGYSNALVGNVVEAIHTVPNIVKPLKRAVRRSSRAGNIPAFVQIDLDEVSGGVYDWKKIKQTIIDECGWVPPDDTDKGLHTSCKIEKCKEYSQFIRFYNMESDMIPFSALEISIASRNRALSRDDAVNEIRSSLGFGLTEIPECEIMKEYIGR